MACIFVLICELVFFCFSINILFTAVIVVNQFEEKSFLNGNYHLNLYILCIINSLTQLNASEVN